MIGRRLQPHCGQVTPAHQSAPDIYSEPGDLSLATTKQQHQTYLSSCLDAISRAQHRRITCSVSVADEMCKQLNQSRCASGGGGDSMRVYEALLLACQHIV